MDPRHPELAIKRMRELLDQYNRIEKDINAATTSAQLGQLEREGGLVVQEMCLVAPRVHEALMQTSRNRRRDLRDLTKMEFPLKLDVPTQDAIDHYVEKLVETPKKKKTSRKKKAEE